MASQGAGLEAYLRSGGPGHVILPCYGKHALADYLGYRDSSNGMSDQADNQGIGG
jgi:hypothetical protein